MDTEAIKDSIKSSFCNLTTFKTRKNALEVITPYSTINSKFISIFVTFTNGKIVLTDSGWVDQNYYETPLHEDSEDIVKRIISSFKTSYNVKSTTDKSGVEYYYKTCSKIDEIPSAVFDLANFVVGVVNSFCIQYKDEKEKETFRKDADDFLKANYSDSVKLKGNLDDLQKIKFNAVVNKGSNIYLITYVTGSTQTHFENDLRKSIVNFEIAAKSKYKELVKEKVSIINDYSEGYNPNKSASIINLLSEKTSQEPIKWSEKEKLLELI